MRENEGWRVRRGRWSATSWMPFCCCLRCWAAAVVAAAAAGDDDDWVDWGKAGRKRDWKEAGGSLWKSCQSATATTGSEDRKICPVHRVETGRRRRMRRRRKRRKKSKRREKCQDGGWEGKKMESVVGLVNRVSSVSCDLLLFQQSQWLWIISKFVLRSILVCIHSRSRITLWTNCSHFPLSKLHTQTDKNQG